MTEASGLRLIDDAALDAGMRQLADIDPSGYRAMIALGGRPPLRVRPPGFEGLASIVVAQQVSTASAAAIFARLAAAIRPLQPDALLAVDDALLRQCGLSASKVRTLRAVASTIASGDLALDRLPTIEADRAHRMLVDIKGIGPWTADVFLLFCLGHPNAFPAGDLALQEAHRLVFGGERRPSALELTALAERWRPCRGVAAYLLWACYRAARGRSGLVLTAS